MGADGLRNSEGNIGIVAFAQLAVSKSLSPQGHLDSRSICRLSQIPVSDAALSADHSPHLKHLVFSLEVSPV